MLIFYYLNIRKTIVPIERFGIKLYDGHLIAQGEAAKANLHTEIQDAAALFEAEIALLEEREWSEESDN